MKAPLNRNPITWYDFLMGAASRLKFSFHKKFAVIPGGSEGIGLAVAARLAALGADVLIGSRDGAKRDRALAALEGVRAGGDQMLCAEAMDVADFNSVRQQAERIVQRRGAPDFLINCAGFAHPGYLDELDVPALREMMDVNYFGTVHTVKAFLPAMRRAGRGHIVNVSSVAGYLGLFGYSGYCASKYAVIGFSWALRHELRPVGIAVSVLCPANTRTPGLERENRMKPREILELEKKIGTSGAEDVANALLRRLPGRGFLIHPTRASRLVYLASRWAPACVVDFFLRRPDPC